MNETISIERSLDCVEEGECTPLSLTRSLALYCLFFSSSSSTFIHHISSMYRGYTTTISFRSVFTLIIFPVLHFSFCCVHVYVTLRLVFFLIFSLTFFFLSSFFVAYFSFVATIAIVAAAAAKNKINQKLSVIFSFRFFFSFYSFIP